MSKKLAILALSLLAIGILFLGSSDDEDRDTSAREQEISNLKSQLASVPPEVREVVKTVEVPGETVEVSTGISQDDYDAVIADLEEAQGEITDLKSQVATLQAKVEAPMTPQDFQGSGDASTAPFTVTGHSCIIKWRYMAALSPAYPSLTVYLYKVGETSYEAKIDSGHRLEQAAAGGSYAYVEPGEYYLKVVALYLSSWWIRVESPNQE